MSILEEIAEKLIQGEDEDVASLTRKALDDGTAPRELLDGGLIAGMDVVGRRFKEHEIFLPEVLMAARAMNAGLDLIKPLLIGDGGSARGTIVLGTVLGDLHDIGKNLVGVMLRGAGFEVVDLGADVSAERFVDAAREHGADVLGMSALLTTTMSSMKQVIDKLAEADLAGKVKVVVGGAPVSAEYAAEIGADAYGYDAANAVECVKALIGERQMKPLLERINGGETLTADGAMGTLLFQMGIETGACPESINLERPDVLRDVARRYLEAGAQIIHTNTFGGSPLKLAMYGLESRAAEINRAAVAPVREVAGDSAYVSASCGPCGKLLKPYGDTAAEAVYASFRAQITAQIEAGADAICVETMTDLGEAKLAVKAAKDLSPRTPVTATMTFEKSRRGFFTIMGTTIEQAAEGLIEAGADVIGSNCGLGIETMIEIAREFRRVSSAPLMIQSNAGLPEMRDGLATYPLTPAEMGEAARELIAIGTSIIGGCCGTTPAHIRAVRSAVDAASG